jgi:hypothetical protein
MTFSLAKSLLTTSLSYPMTIWSIWYTPSVKMRFCFDGWIDSPVECTSALGFHLPLLLFCNLLVDRSDQLDRQLVRQFAHRRVEQLHLLFAEGDRVGFYPNT